MARRLRIAATLSVLALVGCGHLIPAGNQTIEPAELASGAFRLDPDHASVLWRVDHLGYSNFVGRMNVVDATLDFDPQAPEQARLTAVIRADSIDTRLPALDADLKGPSWLDAATYPEIRLVSDAIEVTGKATGIVHGQLTLKGVTHAVALDVTFNGGSNDLLRGGALVLGFAAKTTISRSAYGIDYLVPAIGDDVSIEIDVELVKRG